MFDVVWRCLSVAAWRRGWTSLICCWRGKPSRCGLYTHQFGRSGLDVASTRQPPRCVTYTLHSVGSWASRLRLCVKELTSLPGRSASLHLKKLLVSVCAFGRRARSGLTARRPPACVSVSNDGLDGGNQSRDGADVGASALWDTR